MAASRTERETPESLRRHELAAFLRSRRERLSPEEVGLPSAGRRRTPGLRREEVATLAGVGITWYTWLEQARDISPSRSVLNALARTLMLDMHERRHLFALAGVADELNRCHALADPVRALIEQLEPMPTLASNARFDALAFNRGFAWLLPEVAAEPEPTRNVLRLVFTNPTLRARFTDESVALMASTFRGALAQHGHRPAFKELLASLLTDSREFADLWARHDVRLPENIIKVLTHEEFGRLTFEHTYLWTGRNSDTRLIALLPRDEHTRRTLDDNVGRAPMTPLVPSPGRSFDDAGAEFALA